MADNGLHRHAFWLYGVVVGLAIREALTAVLPHLITPPFENRWESLQEGLRLSAFLILITRFYLGSGYFFDTTYKADSTVKNTNYGLDFLFGSIHFILFYVAAVAIDIHTKPQLLFLILISAVLLYDLVWYYASAEYDTRHELKLWAFYNAVTFIVAGFVYLLVLQFHRPVGEAEGFAMVIVILASWWDVVGMMQERSFIRDALTRLVNR